MNLFITATGTGIGKTFITCGLIRARRRAGLTTSALKPVLSGYQPGTSNDATDILAALGEPVTEAAIAGISPYRFTAPLSPDIAAAREGRSIDFDHLIKLSTADLIEGIGGVMVPLTDRHTVLDWMTALNRPILLVAGSYLGTISHTLTALHALRHLTVSQLIINETPDSPPIDETIATIRRFHPAMIMTAIRYGIGNDDEVFDEVRKKAVLF